MPALSGIKVIDLSRILAGPWASQVLADLGATVIKIENPAKGDDTRSWGPPFLDNHESAYFHSTNRNKKSVTIDFTKPKGQQLIRKLVEGSDILIENFKVGSLEKYGLDYTSLKAINPGLIYCSITGFGQTGPYAHRAGYDALLQAMGGYMGITGAEQPQKVGVAVVDLLTGLYSTVGMLAALQSRHTTGAGQHIDMSLLDVEVACLANQGMNYLVTGESPKRMGNAHPSIVPYQDFPTSDGAMLVAVGNDRQFQCFCNALGYTEWSADPKYATNSDRVLNRQQLVEQIAGITLTRPKSYWIEALEKVNVPCGPINSVAEVFQDPQVISRQMQMTIEGNPSIASPLRLSETPVEYHSPPPKLGQHTGEVLTQVLGLSLSEMEELANSGVITIPQLPN